MSEWISVKEKLPDIGKFVLCYSRHEWIGVARRFDDVEDCPFEWIDEYANYVPQNCVTHWMPLPLPPKDATT